jgi:NAD(P)-dependent dehydrogenase (short-subunit alcohol dehydrogenase family)
MDFEGYKKLFDLTGKVALITGSSKGIGRGIAEAMAAQGAKVVISSRKGEACEAVAKGINDAGGTAVALPCNVSHREQLQQLVDDTRKAFGKIDIVVGNAAVNPFYGSNLDIPDSALDKILQVNIGSNLWLAQMTFPEMIERKDGVFIIVSSIGGLRASTVIGAYCVSKAADMQLVRNLAAEFGKHNIRVNCIAPGLVQTDFARALWEDQERRDKRIAETPMARLGDPEDIAGIAVYLASRAGAWTSGQTFAIDGGVTTAGTG